MKFKTLILLTTLFVISSCQNNETLKLDVNFYSAWHTPIFYSFNLQNETFTISGFKRVITKNDSSHQSYSKDTFVIDFKEDYKFSKSKARRLLKKVKEFGHDTLINYGEPCLDGKGFKIINTYENDTLEMRFSCPRRLDSTLQEGYKIIEHFFDYILEQNFSQKSDSISMRLYNSFDCRIQFLKVSESPIEYRVIGHTISEEALVKDSLLYLDFLKRLPKDELVVCDLTYGGYNFTNSSKSDNVYFYGGVVDNYEWFMKTKKEIDEYGNDTLWALENKERYYDYHHNNTLYKIWLKNKHKNHFLTKQELFETIGDK